jgi:two-component system LytT family response regulator
MICCRKSMEKLLRTIIVDDEAAARRGLKGRLEKAGDFEILAVARNGREALDFIRDHRPDLVFLDVQMPGMDGFDVLRALPPRTMPIIVFVTAVDDWAIRAFRTLGLDYLLKPIGNNSFEETLDRVHQIRKQKRATEYRKSLLDLIARITSPSLRGSRQATARGGNRRQDQERPRLAIRDGGKTTWIRQADIEWIDAAGDYMCVHVGGETHIMRKTMKSLEKELDSSILLRIHRSTIVNIHQVKDMQAHINGEYFLTLKRGHTVKLSRSYKDRLRQFQTLRTPQDPRRP